MKKYLWQVVVFVFFLILSWNLYTAQAQNTDNCSNIQNLFSPQLFLEANSPEDAYEKLVLIMEFADCRAYINCDKIWQRQTYFEPLLIPIVQAIIGLSNNTCAWFAFSIVIDTTFWIPLACCCNYDQTHLQHYCFDWLYDFSYNAFFFYHSCM